MDILLVARPGPLRNAVTSLLLTSPRRPKLALAESGLLALTQLQQARPRLMLVACDEPDEDALELIRQLQPFGPNFHGLVLAHTQAQIDRARLAGAEAGFLYSADSGPLMAAIRECLD